MEKDGIPMSIAVLFAAVLLGVMAFVGVIIASFFFFA